MIDYKEIQNLIKALDESSLTSLEVSHEGLQISLKKECTEKTVYVNSVEEPVVRKQEIVSDKASEVKEERNENLKAVKSPIVGTFYSKPSPDKSPYVSEGDSVKSGDVVCIIEAMKLMNEVKTDFSGEVVKVLAKDGDLIEYGQEIFLIKES